MSFNFHKISEFLVNAKGDLKATVDKVFVTKRASQYATPKGADVDVMDLILKDETGTIKYNAWARTPEESYNGKYNIGDTVILTKAYTKFGKSGYPNTISLEKDGTLSLGEKVAPGFTMPVSVPSNGSSDPFATEVITTPAVSEIPIEVKIDCYNLMLDLYRSVAPETAKRIINTHHRATTLMNEWKKLCQ